MGKKEALKIFEDKNVRVVWDDEQEEWYFSGTQGDRPPVLVPLC